ncbi:hypothetical protein JMG10_11690 [Nostoc ellipsosporum NOK]|nr:hypothetical protein [Nostoc ellipsosporum NOK]
MRFKLLAICLILAASSHAQTTSWAAPDSALADFRENYPQEKVYLHTDRDMYGAGETIWGKLWCLLDQAPSYLSRIAYVELTDRNGKVLQKKMYRLDSLSSAAVDIDIPSGLSTGTYSISAYTLWMLNFPAFINQKNIYIQGTNPAEKNVEAKAALNLSFLPEGGEWILGLNNRLAFHATDANGMPVEVQGYIADNTGTRVTTFKTEHNGMGTVELTPAPGKSYSAFVRFGGSAERKYALPLVKKEGVSLRIENSNSKRLFVLVNRGEQNKNNFRQLEVIAQINYEIVYRAKLDLDQEQNAVSIDKKNLPPGILHVTVFDDKHLPVAERICFIENYKLTQPELRHEEKGMAARKRNTVSFGLPQDQQYALSCQVSSFAAGEPVNTNANNVIASLLLGSDVKGYIHQPGYYFLNKDTTTLRHLDLLLMTQGWRRFEWKQLLSQAKPTLVYPVESAMSYRGTVTKSDSKEIIKDGKVSFMIRGVDSSSLLAEATLTDKGEFMLPDVNFIKSAEVAYMGTDNKRSNFIVDVHLTPTYIDSLQQSRYRPGITLDSAEILAQQRALALAMNQHTQQLQDSVKMLNNIVIKSRKLSREDSLNAAYAGGPFLMGRSIDPAAYKSYRSIWQMIQAAIPGITIEGNPFSPTSVTMNRFAGMGSASGGTEDMAGSSDGSISNGLVMENNGIAYFLNEVNVSFDVISTLTVEDVALIKVLKNEAAALGASQGAIAIYTKTGFDATARVYDKRYIRIRKEGYAVSRDFFDPPYASGETMTTADQRYTLYWSGKLRPANDKQYRFRFFNNDTGSKFKVLIQGIGKDGELIWKEQILE